MFALPVTVYEIIKCNLSKWSRIESMTFKKVNIMSYNIAKYVIGWRLVKKIADLSQTVSCNSPMRRFEYLILKMKVKNVEDVDENWQTKVSCQPAYA